MSFESERRSLQPLSSVDRRGFVKGALIGGFAAATVPVSATTIQTSTAGLEAGEVTIPVGPDKLPAYRARPLTGRDWPLVIVIQEIFGVHEHIRDVCRRFAKLGAYAIAPELFVRQGNPGAVADMQTLMREIVARVPDTQVMSDLDATLAWSRADGATGKAGITGFCWGGRITWLYSAHSDAIAAGVAWYGRLWARRVSCSRCTLWMSQRDCERRFSVFMQEKTQAFRSTPSRPCVGHYRSTASLLQREIPQSPSTRKRSTVFMLTIVPLIDPMMRYRRLQPPARSSASMVSRCRTRHRLTPGAASF
jgi:dienelactone hydrolase